jgi:hypothetical protein
MRLYTRFTVTAGLTMAVFAPPLPASGQVASVYTSLGEDRCRTTQVDEESGFSRQRCRGLYGYNLVVHDDDARVSIDVHPPTGAPSELDFWEVVTRAFSSLGPRAEWRISNRRVRALIVRVNANEDAERPNLVTSYLVVARPVRGRWCVTHRIAPSPNANSLARRAADATAPRCLTAAP